MGRLLKILRKKIGANGGDTVIFLVSLLLASALWLIQNLSLNYSSVVSVNVTARSNLDGYSDVSANSSTISARCRTSGFKYLRLQRAKDKTHDIFINPADLHLKEGEIFYINSSELTGYVNDLFGDNVQLESFLSQNVQFRFPVENFKKVPVRPVHNISYRDQYTAMEEMSVTPDSVLVYGEPYHLQSVEQVYTETIRLDNLKNSAHGTVKLEKISGVRLSEDVVNYALEVTRFVDIPSTVRLAVRNAPAGKTFSVYPSSAQVVFKCAFPLTEDPSEADCLYIDWNDFNSSINGRCVPRASRLPRGVISYTVSPQVFEVVENGKK